jgi:hypothetical protein
MSALPPIRVTKAKEVMPNAQRQHPVETPAPVTDVVPASEPVVVQTEEERRQQEALEYVQSRRVRPQQTPEQIEAIRQETLATIPRANGIPIPEVAAITEEQMRNNPSNYQPAIAETAQASAFQPTPTGQIVPSVTHNPSVLTEAARPAVAATPKDEDPRQQWVCVQGDGIRTVTDAVKHPVFGSDAHLMDQLVKCPQCGSISVRKLGPGEDPDRHP